MWRRRLGGFAELSRLCEGSAKLGMVPFAYETGGRMNQKDLIKYGLLALGAYLIWEYIQKNGGISGLFGTTAAAGTTPIIPGTTAGVPPLTSILPNAPATPTPPAQPPAPTPVGTLRTINGTQYQWNGSAWLQTAPANPNLPPAPAPPVPISQQMLNAAGTNNLDMFQWSYYWTQITGQPSPADPNAIDPSVYAGAGIVDSSSPTDVGTWLAIMQNQAPQLGLMGLGARFTPAWLM
jgi:hypothetical protein